MGEQPADPVRCGGDLLWAHTEEVARHARWAAAGIRSDDRDLLVAAAHVHDIGYAGPITYTGFHPLDGARHLRHLGLHELACLVAHHTGAHIEADHRGLRAEFRRPTGPVADALTYCDVTSGPTGQAMDPGDRFEEIVHRHGEDSIVAHSRAEARAELYGAAARTLRRATRNRSPDAALSITPVRPGCTTLVRLHGALDDTTADHATQTLTLVLNHHPHAVLIDLALVTAMTPPGHEPSPTLRGAPRAPPSPWSTRADATAPSSPAPKARAEHLPIVYGIETALTPHCD